MRPLRLLLCAFAVVSIVGCSNDPKPGTMEAAAAGEHIMRSMSDTLAQAKTFTFETSERLEMIAPTGDKRTLQFIRKVAVRRPDALFFEIQGKEGTALNVSVYYDGHTITMNDDGGKEWASAAVASNLDDAMDEVARRFSLPVPIADVVYSSPRDAFIGRTTKGGFAGHEDLNGLQCTKLIYDDEFVEVQLWIPDSGQPLPRRLEIVYKTSSTLPVSQIDFTNWNLGASVPDSMFAFNPGDDRRRVEVADFVTGMKAGAMPALPNPTPAPPKAKHKVK